MELDEHDTGSTLYRCIDNVTVVFGAGYSFTMHCTRSLDYQLTILLETS